MTSDTDFPLVEVYVPSGPIGVILDTDFSGKTTVVAKWKPMPTGTIGPVQRSGKVSIGDVLVMVDDKSVTEMDYKDVIEYVRSVSHRSRKMVFQNSKEFYRAKRLSLVPATRAGESNTEKLLAAAVVDTRVIRVDGKPKYCEYQLSVAAPSKKVLGSPIRRWHVWRRYSEFLKLDEALRQKYGWQLEKISFPPKRAFFNLDEQFILSRREALDEYISKIFSIRGIVDFDKGSSSQELKAFLEYDKHEEADKPGKSVDLNSQSSPAAFTYRLPSPRLRYATASDFGS